MNVMNSKAVKAAQELKYSANEKKCRTNAQLDTHARHYTTPTSSIMSDINRLLLLTY